LGVGLSTLNKWVQKRQHEDLLSGSLEVVEKENTRLRKELRLVREEREVLKKAAVGSTGQRKSFVEPIRGCLITKCFPWARIELQRNLVRVVLAEG
jgi:transposase-like protein